MSPSGESLPYNKANIYSKTELLFFSSKIRIQKEYNSKATSYSKLPNQYVVDGLQVNYACIDSLRQMGGSNQEQLEPLEHQLLAKGSSSVYYTVIYKYYHSIFFYVPRLEKVWRKCHM